MERVWPADQDFYPISKFSLFVPLGMTALSMVVMFLKIFRFWHGEKYSHSKGQENANTQPAKYQQSTLGSTRVASSQLVPQSRIPVSVASKGDNASSQLSTPSGAVGAKKATSSQMKPKK
ncbi:hypothetical protein TYRP_010502 [Tyrophagus putrescentiae]|nr:hypothetical protein TYRP_010502 [Tyrophagus putrescentiae]